MSIELIIGISGIGLTVVLLILTIGSFLWMARNDYRHLDAKIDAIRSESKTYAECIQKDMRDFHGRLEKQDAEFKAFMRDQERERTKVILKR